MIRSLDLFILSLIQQGLSVGSTLPTFRRLLKTRLVKEEKPRSVGRRRREFALTAAGRKVLQNAKTHLDQLSADAAGDLEATLRFACLALFWGDPKVASQILARAADEFEDRSENSQRIVRKRVEGHSDLASMYRGLLFMTEAHRQKSAAKRLRALASEFESAPLGNRVTVEARRPRR
jgi:DNA-binding PadR family transcriptional regulator